MQALADPSSHALYVWSSYAVCAVVLGVLVLLSWRRSKRREHEIRQLERSRRPRWDSSRPTSSLETREQGLAGDDA